MVRITDTAAEVLHGHEKKEGSKTDKPKGAIIHSYPFAKYGKAEAIKKAYAQHEAIVKSEERTKDHEAPTASTVAVRSGQTTVGSTVKPQYPVKKTIDGKADMAADTPELGAVPDVKPSNDADSTKYPDDNNLHLLSNLEEKDLNGVTLGNQGPTGKDWITRQIEPPLGYSKMNHEEYVIKSDEAVGIGLGKDAAANQFPQANIKQDATSEAVANRDKPVYNEEDDDGDGDSDMWVEAFSAGQHTDSEGTTRKWDPTTLVNIAQQYNTQADAKNPNRKLAPVVLGHPKDNAPAYGWIEKVKVVGDKLKAKLSELNPGFVEALKQGAYKTRSISLYPDLNIRHIGFLGAVQPAVPGLGPFKFEENDKAITIEFQEEDMSEEVTLLKKENNFFKKLFSMFKVDIDKSDFVEFKQPDENTLALRVPQARGVDDSYDKKGESTMADTSGVTPRSDAEVLEPGDAVKEQPIQDIKADKDELTKLREEVAKLTSDLQKVTQEKDAFEKELGSKEVRMRTGEHREFCEKLIAAGQLRPADLDQTVLNLELRYKADSATSDFAEKKETPSVESYKEYLSAMPHIVCFEEVATAKLAGNLSEEMTAEKTVSNLIETCMKEKGCDYQAAFAEIAQKHPAEMQAYVAAL